MYVYYMYKSRKAGMEPFFNCLNFVYKIHQPFVKAVMMVTQSK